jgi:hypothetical protein
VVAAFNNSLIVAGGYRGTVLDDLIATTVPISIARPNSVRFRELWLPKH